MEIRIVRTRKGFYGFRILVPKPNHLGKRTLRTPNGFEFLEFSTWKEFNKWYCDTLGKQLVEENKHGLEDLIEFGKPLEIHLMPKIGEFTKEEADIAHLCAEDLFHAIPKSRQPEQLGAWNELLLFIEVAKKNAPNETKEPVSSTP